MENESQKVLIAKRYEIRDTIGKGGSGSVFKAWDTQLHRFVAVKRWNAPEPLLDDPEGTERLWREAMTLAAIQHPNILTIHDFGVDDEGPYVITEFVDGETLEVIIKRGRFDLDAFAEAAQQTLEALIAAHQAGLIHRDLKPQNIMRTRLASGAWQYKILDFGLARFVTQPTVQSMEGNTTIYGSIYYIAPEQLRHQPLDARTDIYAMGCLYYYMLSGQNAVEGDTIPSLITSHLEHAVKPLSEWRPDLPAKLCDWVMKALAFSPDDRFASAAVALAALHKVLPNAVHQTSIRVAPPTPSLQIIPVQSVPPPDTGILKIRPPAHKTGPTPITREPATPRSRARGRIIPIAAIISFLLLLAAIVPLWFRTHPTAPQTTIATSWRDETSTVEDVITAWPPSIATARRSLIQKYFEQMRDLEGPRWGSIGAVLEALAVVQYNNRTDPKESRAISNLTYHDDTGRTLGELDIVIWNMRENRAEIVYEAAISDQLHRKGTSSRNQVQRFADAVKEGKAARILYHIDPSWKFDQSQFDQVRIEILGNQGALSAGFDAEVDITRFEADYLQSKLIAWRNAARAKQRESEKK